MILLSKLRRLFYGKPGVIQTQAGVRRLTFRLSRANWIVGRGLCMYRCEDFGTVPRGRRRRALELKLPVWSPFERTGHHAVWSGGVAMVWFWDSDKIATDHGEIVGTTPALHREIAKKPRVLPETVFYGRKADGLHLQPCENGFEIQRWHANILKDAFWFPAYPEESQFSWFLARYEGEAGELPLAADVVPAPAGRQMMPEPWSTSPEPGEWFAANRQSLVTACFLALTLAVVWQEARYWKIYRLEEAAAEEYDRLQERLTPMFEARAVLMELRRSNLALLDLLREPSQALLMKAVDQAIPGVNAEFREWRYRRGELKVSIEDRNPDSIAYIRALEAVPLFSQVRAEPGRERDRLEITLKIRE